MSRFFAEPDVAAIHFYAITQKCMAENLPFRERKGFEPYISCNTLIYVWLVPFLWAENGEMSHT
jgi:hypothetical protein